VFQAFCVFEWYRGATDADDRRAHSRCISLSSGQVRKFARSLPNRLRDSTRAGGVADGEQHNWLRRSCHRNDTRRGRACRCKVYASCARGTHMHRRRAWCDRARFNGDSRKLVIFTCWEMNFKLSLIDGIEFTENLLRDNICRLATKKNSSPLPSTATASKSKTSS